MSAQLKQYKAFRQICVNQMSELKDFAENAASDEKAKLQFGVMYRNSEAIKVEFRKHHKNVISIMAAGDEDIVAEEAVRKSFEFNASYVAALHTQHFDNKQVANLPDETILADNKCNLKLPRLQIAKFTGDITKFKPFIDLYNSSIHGNNGISNVEKFNYLVSFLEGPPLKLVQCVPVTADNYQTAYDSLIKRYENKRLIAFAHLKAIDNAPFVQSNKSSRSLRTLIDIFSENLAALENMDFPVDQWDFLLFYTLSAHLDQDTISRFELEEHKDSTEIPTFQSLRKFIIKQCDALDAVEFSSHKSLASKPCDSKNRVTANSYSPRMKSTTSFFCNSGKVNCGFCSSSSHLIYKCPDFQRKSPQERYDSVKNKHLCTNCLSKQHVIRSCNSQSRCRYCEAKHHSLLHFKVPETRNSNPATLGETRNDHEPDDSRPLESSNDSQFCGMASNLRGAGEILLQTALVEITDSRGLFHRVRVLLDSGSQCSYISQRCFRRLGFKSYDCPLIIQGLGEMVTTASHGSVTCTIKPINKNGPVLSVTAAILPRLCPDMPYSDLTNTNWPHIANIQLADPNYNKPGTIDLILGAELYPYILQNGRICGNPGEPVAMNTIFGWVLTGKVTCHPTRNVNTTSLFTVHASNDLVLSKSIKRFWELEEIPNDYRKMFPSDELCENIYVRTHSRSETGRYIVELPFKDSEPHFDFENSRAIALRRFLSLEKRLIADPVVYKQYSEIFREYLEFDYLEIVPENSVTKTAFYIPHHCVSKAGKMRIVHDASVKLKQGISLNDTLLVGPKLQKNIADILLHFRLHPVVFTCDIKAMFMQILVAEKHRDFLRILWRFSPQEPLKELRFKRVIFGLSSAPYLANRTLLQLARDETNKYPLASKVLENDFYVDDCVSGASSLVHAKAIRDQLVALLESGGFELRKWSSNSRQFLSDLPAQLIADSNSLNFDSEPSVVKILGLRWHPDNDSFFYHVECNTKSCTKRNILSEIARIFDPLGFLAPLTLFAKGLMQSLWSLGLEWDEEPPPLICDRWLQFKSELPLLSDFKLPRQMLLRDFSDCQIHGFADASLKAYACVVYFRFQKGDVLRTFFVISKSKVAPLKQVSIPRLELCAALLLAETISYIMRVFQGRIAFSETVAWVDSTVALAWIKSPPYKYKTFVSNRIARIQELVAPTSWRHVNSKDNPADAASRGRLPSELIQDQLWLTGPAWLRLGQQFWPQIPGKAVIDNADVAAEQRKVVLAAFVGDNFINSLINDVSSLLRIQRILSYILRFINNCKNSDNRSLSTCTHCTPSELHSALIVLIKHAQSIHFADDISNLQSGKPISKYLRKLNAFLDDKYVLRVGGRLTNSELSYDRKHPIILTRKCRLTTLIIEHFHRTYSHPGAQTLQFLLVQQFWILSAKSAIRSVTSKCQKCWKVAPRNFQPFMGNLPKLRVSQIKPFSCVGVDYAGPFTVTLGKTRGAKTLKSYICLFVCFATKAIHLELSSDLSSEAFLCALRRFISRRGRCSKIYSDCGSNFIGANKQISQYLKKAVEGESIEWCFHPPSAPHFSGLAEAGVKSVKTHLRRVIGEQVLTYEEFYTVLVQIEALLNSRPLCPMSADPNDLSVLTPGHFLTLEPLSALSDPDLSHLKMNRLSRWQMLQRLHQDFWARWHRDYLHTLQQRSKWLESAASPLTRGSLVLIKNDSLPPSKWNTGRILDLHPGDDGITRVVTVRTRHGDFKRPVVKLCPLPFQN